MSGQLNALGVVKFFSDLVGNHLASLSLGWPPIFGLLSVSYFALHYMFASQTAHVSALYAAFVAMMMASGKHARLPDVCIVIPASNSNSPEHENEHQRGHVSSNTWWHRGYLDLHPQQLTVVPAGLLIEIARLRATLFKIAPILRVWPDTMHVVSLYAPKDGNGVHPSATK